MEKEIKKTEQKKENDAPDNIQGGIGAIQLIIAIIAIIMGLYFLITL